MSGTALILRIRVVSRAMQLRRDAAGNDIQNELDATLTRLDDLAYLDAAPLVHTALIEYRAGKITLQTLLSRVQDAYDDYGNDWTDSATTITKQRALLNNVGTIAGTVGAAAVAGHSLDMVTRTEQDDIISRSHAYVIERASTLASQEFDTDRLTALEMLATQRLDDDADSIFDAYGRGDISFAQARQQYTTAAQADTWYSYQDMRNQYAIQDEDSTHAWWETDSPKTGSCDDCAVREEESPYLIEELPGLPCDGSTQCGPGCLCTVRYGSLVERRFFQRRTATIVRYSDDQPRDERGRWSSGGSSGDVTASAPDPNAAARMARNAAMTGDDALKQIGQLENNYIDKAANLDMAKQTASQALRDHMQAWDQRTDAQTMNDPGYHEEMQKTVELEERWAQAVEARNALEAQSPTREHILEQVIYQNTGSGALRARIDFSLDPATMQTALTGSRDFERMVDPSLLSGPSTGPKIIAETDTSFYAGRSSYSVGLSEVNLTPNAKAESVVHELGHYMEDINPDVQTARAAFYDRRTAGEDPRPMNDITNRVDFHPSEVARPDKFEMAYSGKVYNDTHTSEIISTGLQMMYANPARFARNDPDFFKFIYNTVRMKSR